MPKKRREAQTIRKLHMNRVIKGKNYPYVYLVEIGREGEDAIGKFLMAHPSSGSALKESVLPEWRAFVPFWCSPHNPTRFFKLVTHESHVLFRVENYDPPEIRERLVRYVRPQMRRFASIRY